MSPGNHRRFAMYNVAWRFEFQTWYDFIQEIVPIWRQYHAGDGVSLMLTHCGLVMPYGVRHLGHHWFIVIAYRLFGASSVPSHYMNYSWLKSKYFHWGNLIQNIVRKMSAILLWHQWVNIHVLLQKMFLFCWVISVVRHDFITIQVLIHDW